jgi:dipeptidyl aminopeptidase/acylaminoacyl peptidase
MGDEPLCETDFMHAGEHSQGGRHDHGAGFRPRSRYRRSVRTYLAVLLCLMAPVGAMAATQRDVTLPGGNGDPLAGTLTIPDGPGPHPAVLIVGGFGPGTRDGAIVGGPPGGLYAAWARALADRGVMTLRYDKRGIGRSPGPALAWLDLPALTRDATAALRWLESRPPADRARTGAIGHSQGGDIALRSGRQGRADRVVTMAAPARPLGRLGAGIRRIIVRVGGERAARETLQRDPRVDAARLPAPTLVVHGTRDATVPYSDARALVSARRAAGRPVALLTLGNADHSLAVGARTPPAAWNRIARFVSS